MAKKSLRIFLQWGNRDSFDEDVGDEENTECWYGRQRIGNEPAKMVRGDDSLKEQIYG